MKQTFCGVYASNGFKFPIAGKHAEPGGILSIFVNLSSYCM